MSYASVRNPKGRMLLRPTRRILTAEAPGVPGLAAISKRDVCGIGQSFAWDRGMEIEQPVQLCVDR